MPLRKIKRYIHKNFFGPEIKIDQNYDFIFLGNDYGGWPIVDGKIDASSTVLSFGIGRDVSFDTAVISRFGCRVHGFDPTPRSKEWLALQRLPDSFVFHSLGIAARDGEAEFFAPARDGNVSFSASPSVKKLNVPVIKAEVLRLETIVSRLGLPHPDVLKMDIEGFEYDVISDILCGPIRPRQMLVEFHHGMYKGITNEHTKKAVSDLRAAGYDLFYISDIGYEYAFTLRNG